MARAPATIMIGDATPGQRLDRALAAALPDLSRTRLQSLIRDGAVTSARGALTDPAMKIAADTGVLRIAIPEPAPAIPRPENIPLAIVFEDDDLIVVDKPAGLVVHPSAGHETGTLVHALLHHCAGSLSGIGGVMRPGIVHRLDKDTSGLLVAAKNDRAHRGLAAQFADHGRTGPLERVYSAIVWGAPSPRRRTIAANIERHPHDRERMTVVRPPRGRAAVTHVEVRESFFGADGPNVASLVACALETGRTHQIRVHLAHEGHPLLGDRLYGTGFRTKASKLTETAQAALGALGRQALHAGLLGFAHPLTGDPMRFESPIPEDMAKLLEALRAAGPFADSGR